MHPLSISCLQPESLEGGGHWQRKLHHSRFSAQQAGFPTPPRPPTRAQDGPEQEVPHIHSRAPAESPVAGDQHSAVSHENHRPCSPGLQPEPKQADCLLKFEHDSLSGVCVFKKTTHHTRKIRDEPNNKENYNENKKNVKKHRTEVNENKNIKLCGLQVEMLRGIFIARWKRGKDSNQSSKFLPQETRKRTKSTILSSKKEIEPRAEINETENRKTAEEINETKKIIVL